MPRTSVSCIASLAIGALAVATTAGTALANPMCDTQTPALGGTVSCEYDLGGSTTITVPPGTIAIDVTLRGGGGGAGGTMSGSVLTGRQNDERPVVTDLSHEVEDDGIEPTTSTLPA